MIIFERDGANLSIRMNKIPAIMEKNEDPMMKEFFDTASKLGEEVMMTLFNTNDLDKLPVEFSEHDEYAELKFGNTGLFETVFHLLENIFYGDIVRDVIQGNRRSMENMIRELKRYSQ